MAHFAFLPNICDNDADLASAMQSVGPVEQAAAVEMAKLLMAEMQNRNIELTMSSVRSAYGGTWTTDDPRLRVVLQDLCRQTQHSISLWGDLSKDCGPAIASLGVSIVMVCARARRNEQFKAVAKFVGAGLLGGLLGGMIG
jgi:hypothetical protein